jgi:hypothetical protein
MQLQHGIVDMCTYTVIPCILQNYSFDNDISIQILQSPDHADLMAIADRLQRSFIKPWLEIQPDPPRLQAVEHLFKDSHPPLPSIGQVKTVLKHLNPRKATGLDNIPAWCLKRYAE